MSIVDVPQGHTAVAARAIDRSVAPPPAGRWSTRAFMATPIPDEVLYSVFEAARLAPPTADRPPWCFVYAKRGSEAWPKLQRVLSPAKRFWASRASALIVVCVRSTFEPSGRAEASPLASAPFDDGAAWASFALQAFLLGWTTHPMGSFDRQAARHALNVPDDHAIEAVVAVGKSGDMALLTPKLQPPELPRGRRPLADCVFEGAFP